MEIEPFILAALLTCASAGVGAQKPAGGRTFKGKISDSACGLHHMMGGSSPPKCALECVDLGAKFVLVNQSTQKVYGLSGQTAARPYAGEPVKVTGTLKGSILQITSIQPLTRGSK